MTTVAGVGLAVAGGRGEGELSVTGLGALLTVVGVVLLGPAVARPAAGLLGAPAPPSAASRAPWPGATRCATPGAPPGRRRR